MIGVFNSIKEAWIEHSKIICKHKSNNYDLNVGADFFKSVYFSTQVKASWWPIFMNNLHFLIEKEYNLRSLDVTFADCFY